MAIPEEVPRHIELAEEELSSAKILLQNSKLRYSLLKYGELISPIVIKPEEFKRRKDSFIKTVMSEGKPLYSSGLIL